MANNNESEVKSWLEIILKEENIKNMSVKILGNSGKGDGYIGDIVFVEVTGNTSDGNKKYYKLVLKCSKRNKTLRDKTPIQEAFLNEIFVYDTILPEFMLFQKEKGVEDPFNTVAKCYGTLVTENMEIIALENLKEKGYILWDRKLPYTRKQVDLIMEGYGKLHAISIAMKDQQPERFQKLTEPLLDFFKHVILSENMIKSLEDQVDEVYDLLKDDLDKNVLIKWKNFKQEVRPLYENFRSRVHGMKVITHADCWGNNFMHFFTDGEPTTIAMLDWQLTYLTSPIYDLSYFLFSCIAEEDINDLDTILKCYHNTLRNFVEKLGSNPDLYPLEQFLEEWKEHCKFGISFSNMIHKFIQTDNEEIPDVAQSVENGEDLSETFTRPIKNTDGYKHRRAYIINYLVKNNLI